jgi:hypothetical protein
LEFTFKNIQSLEIDETLPKLYKKKAPKERERKRSKGKRMNSRINGMTECKLQEKETSKKVARDRCQKSSISKV